MKDKKARFPLNFKAAVIMAAISVVFCLVSTTMCSFTFSRTNEDLFRKQARDLAYTASLSLDGDELMAVTRDVMETYHSIPEDDLVTSEDWGSPEFDAYLAKYEWIYDTPEYAAVYETLSLTQNGGIAALNSVYTLIYDSTYEEPLAIYIVDAAGEGACPPGVIDTFKPEDDYDAVKDPSNGIRSYVSNTEEYGCLVSAGVPVYDSSGEYAAFLVVDLSMNEINDHVYSFTLQLMGVILIVAAVICILSLAVITATVTRPLKRLSHAAVGYIRNTENRETFESLGIERSDEIGDLSDAMKQMESDLHVYIRDLTAMTAERERMGAELNVATKIQRDMLPTNFPERSDLSLYALMTPAKEVGGDFYDFFFTDSDHLALVMGDVSGKGVPAALFMVIAKSVIRNITMLHLPMHETAALVNNILCENDNTGFFVTAWIGLLDVRSGELVSVNAGHEYPAVKRKNGAYELILSENNPPLAAMEDTVFAETAMKLGPGDSLFLYTDGVPEAKSISGERYGTDKMLEVLNGADSSDLNVLLTTLKESLDTFMDKIDPFDDITMLGINYYGRR